MKNPSRILVIGDLHGKIDVIEDVSSLLDNGVVDQLIFVGDVVDSYDTTVEDQIDSLDMVLDLVESEKARVIYGNHELSYLMPSMRCSGFQSEIHIRISTIKSRIESCFENYVLLPDNILITHAGLSKGHLEISGFDNHQEYLLNGKSRFHDIGVIRGGSDEYGGIFWSDFRYDFEPIEGLRQVFGHTRTGSGVTTHSGNYCVDCLNTSREAVMIEYSSNIASIDVVMFNSDEIQYASFE